MKEIKLVPLLEQPCETEVSVRDFPRGRENGTERERFRFAVGYGPDETDRFRKKNWNMEQILDDYRRKIEDIIRVHIMLDFEIVGGMKETLDIVRSHLETEFGE